MPPVVGLAEQPEQDDVLLEGLEERADRHLEAVAEPGQVGGPADGHPCGRAVVGHRLDEGVDHAGLDGRARSAAPGAAGSSVRAGTRRRSRSR